MGVRDGVERIAREARWVTGEAARVTRETWREVRDENVTFMAGSIAYHAFVSMLPLLLFALVVLSTVGDEAFTASLAETTEQFLTPYARELLVDSLDVATARTGVSVVGAVTLLWGTSKIFRGLDVAFSEIYGTETKKSLLEQFKNAVVVFAALGVAGITFLAAGAVAALAPVLPYPAVFDPFFLVVGFGIAFFPIYYVFPDVDVTPLEVLPGAVVAAVGWTALEALFQGYVSIAGRYEAVYGALGSAFLLLIWLYFGGLLLLVGGVVNAVLAGRTGDEHATRFTDEVSADAGPTERGGRLDAQGGPARGRSEEVEPRRTGPGRPVERPHPDQRLDAPSDSDDAVARLATENERLRAENLRLGTENDRLRAENDRLERRNDALVLRMRRQQRSVWERAKRWLFEE